MLRQIREFIPQICAAFFLCALPWGGTGWMWLNEFYPRTLEMADSLAKVQNLEKETVFYYGGGKDTLAAGTTIKVLGYYMDVPEDPNEGLHPCLIEYGNARGLATLYGKVDVVNVFNDHLREKELFKFHLFVFPKDARSMVGKTYKEVEKLLGPATYRYDKDGITYAIFPGYEYLDNGQCRLNFWAAFKDGVMTNEYGGGRSTEHTFPLWMLKVYDYWMKHSCAYGKTSFYTYRLKKNGPFNPKFYPFLWIPRAIQGVFDTGYIVLVFIISTLVMYFTIYRIRALSNIAVLLIHDLVTVVALYLYALNYMEMSANFLLYFFGMFVAIVQNQSFLDYHRCPNCHAVAMNIVSITPGQKTYNQFDTHHNVQRETGEKHWSHGYDTDYEEKYYTTTHWTVGQDYDVGLCCAECGYKRTEMGHKTLKSGSETRHTGTDTWTEETRW